MSAHPVNQSERNTIVDILRGFALLGVLFANFTGYVYQNLPSAVFDKSATSLDYFLINFNSIFLEWKFMTIFSILFGYGFGLLISSFEKKGLNPLPYFSRRMFWLFIIGILHTLFWWGDVLHLYAFSGIFLLLFRRATTKTVAVSAVVFMFFVPLTKTFIWGEHPSYFTDDNLAFLYDNYKYGSITEVFSFNFNFYYHAFILTGADLHDCLETFGRFLFGYYLLRIKLFDSIQLKQSIFKKALAISAPFTLLYFVATWLSIADKLDTSYFLWEPFLKAGVFASACFYSSAIILHFIKHGDSKLLSSLKSIGSMTLTNYLLISAVMVTLLYGIGFGKLGELPMHIVWLLAGIWLAAEIICSRAWLKRFRYGPAEWIWRQLTYKQLIKLRK